MRQMLLIFERFQLKVGVKFCVNNNDYCMQVNCSLHLQKINLKEISVKLVWRRCGWTVDLLSLHRTEIGD